MAARTNPSKGGKPDKLIRDALIIELKREALDTDGKMSRKLNILAAKLVEAAMGGNVQAAALVADRVDGKAQQEIDVKHEGEVTFRSAAISALDEIIAGTTGRAADSSSEDPLPN